MTFDVGQRYRSRERDRSYDPVSIRAYAAEPSMVPGRSLNIGEAFQLSPRPEFLNANLGGRAQKGKRWQKKIILKLLKTAEDGSKDYL